MPCRPRSSSEIARAGSCFCASTHTSLSHLWLHRRRRHPRQECALVMGASPRMPTFGGWACAMPLYPNDDAVRNALAKSDPQVRIPDTYALRLFRSRCNPAKSDPNADLDRCRMHAVPLSLQLKRLHAPRCKCATSGAVALACLDFCATGSVLCAPKIGRINQQLALLVRLCTITITGLHTTRSPAELAAHRRRRLLARFAVVLRSAVAQ